MNGPICQCFTNVVECITMKPHLGHSFTDFTSICMKRSEKILNFKTMLSILDNNERKLSISCSKTFVKFFK